MNFTTLAVLNWVNKNFKFKKIFDVNFIYSINIRELEKFLLGIHKTNIAINNINDHYFENIEFISLKTKSFKEKKVCLKLKATIFLKDILCNLSLLNFSIGEVVLFKDKPSLKIIDKLKKSKWNYWIKIGLLKKKIY